MASLTLRAAAAQRQACSTSYARAPAAAPSPPLRRAVAAAAHPGGIHPDPSTPLYPSMKEEKDVSHEAFMHAMEAARPRAMRIPGMQEFAASVWERRRRIPSQNYTDPLDHIFTEFDTDNDGKLSAEQISRALVGRGVEATAEQVQMFVESSDQDGDHLVSRQEFPAFIFHMASADLRCVSSMTQTPVAPAAPHIVLPEHMGGSPGSSMGEM